MRGNPNDYDQWAIKSGDLRWSYEYLRKYFQRIEDYHGHWENADGNGKNKNRFCKFFVFK